MSSKLFPATLRLYPPLLPAVAALAMAVSVLAPAADPPPEPDLRPTSADPAGEQRQEPYHQTGHFSEETTDADGDGVPDIDDNCPDTVRKPDFVTPGGKVVSMVDSCGCPVDPCVLDADNDGINECLDRCPNTYAGHRVGADGCPLPIEENERVKLDVKFEFDKSDISAGFEQDLMKVRGLLLRFPEVTVTLEGHTDWMGSDAYNQKLSERRANACRTFLLADPRIAPTRVRAVGYGESRPLDTNETEEGRARNRRTVAELAGGRTIVPVNEEPPPLDGLESETTPAPP